jgi:hypothetical protein
MKIRCSKCEQTVNKNNFCTFCGTKLKTNSIHNIAVATSFSDENTGHTIFKLIFPVGGKQTAREVGRKAQEYTDGNAYIVVYYENNIHNSGIGPVQMLVKRKINKNGGFDDCQNIHNTEEIICLVYR